MKKKRASAKEVYTLADLQSWRDANPPIRVGIFGDPVEHSLSPQMQNAALKHSKIDIQYARFHILPSELREALDRVRELGFVGLNLTLPHKIAAPELLDRTDDDAKQIGAVNVIKSDNGKLHGFNTDGLGFARAIREEFSVDLRDLRVMILGAGGAARAIAFECAKSHCERLVIANGTFEKGERLAEKLRNFFEGPKVLGPVPRLQAIRWEEGAFQFQIANVDLVVNATPVGLNRGDASPLSARLLAPHLMVYDTIYSAERTPLISAAIEAGARVANGLSMLLHQGALAFEIWFERSAPLEVMRKALL
ncbi:MAG TPA: shikimate dehydrogenase [Chthoniobacterales bacterium]|jgi:shikimate dehydrogenase|nr:shikimate dehydrogenase [Chthoniobacterales bacterium]